MGNGENNQQWKKDEERREIWDERLRRFIKLIPKIIIWLVIIAVVIFLTLFISSRIGEFDSIADMIRFIRAQFE